jgi:hypothetical protein
MQRDEMLRSAAPTTGCLPPNVYPLVPLSVETYGRLGKLAVTFLGMLGAEAVAAGNVSKIKLCRRSVTGA